MSHSACRNWKAFESKLINYVNSWYIGFFFLLLMATITVGLEEKKTLAASLGGTTQEHKKWQELIHTYTLTAFSERATLWAVRRRVKLENLGLGEGQTALALFLWRRHWKMEGNHQWLEFCFSFFFPLKTDCSHVILIYLHMSCFGELYFNIFRTLCLCLW